MKEIPNCEKCGSAFTYQDGTVYICPECSHEWAEDEEPKNNMHEIAIRDAHGNILKDGDSVTIIKDIKVKGSSSVIKVGVKVKTYASLMR